MNYLDNEGIRPRHLKLAFAEVPISNDRVNGVDESNNARNSIVVHCQHETYFTNL